MEDCATHPEFVADLVVFFLRPATPSFGLELEVDTLVGLEEEDAGVTEEVDASDPN